jgi:protein-disulfide isomerase
MIANQTKRGLRSLGVSIAVALAVAGLQAGCSKSRELHGSARPRASGSASASASVAGPCAPFVKKVCAGAGETSQTCQQVKGTTELLSDAACRAVNRDADFVVKKLAEKRKDCDTLVSKLCAELGKTSDTCKMVETQTKTFPPERCSAMLGRYKDVLTELKRMEDAKKPLDAAKQALIASADAPSFGPANARVTIVEFSDFQCPYCSRAASTAKQVKEKYADKVRFVFRQFPLSFHQNAHLAAEASLAAAEQGKFWDYHDKMFANQNALDRASLEKYAKEVGLKPGEFKKALDDKKFAAKVDAEMKLGQDVAVQGTPTMFLNGKRVDNPTDFAALSKLIEDALKG